MKTFFAFLSQQLLFRLPNALIDAAIEDFINLMIAGIFMAFLAINQVSMGLAVGVFVSVAMIVVMTIVYQAYKYSRQLELKQKQTVMAIRERRRSRSISSAASPSPRRAEKDDISPRRYEVAAHDDLDLYSGKARGSVLEATPRSKRREDSKRDRIGKSLAARVASVVVRLG